MAQLSRVYSSARAAVVCLVVVVCLVGACRAAPSATPLVDLVDTRIGTGGHGFGVGSINPGAQVPFGAMRLGPDTSLDGLILRWQHFGGYYYYDNSIDAFSHTHLVGAGVGDWGNVGVMVTRSISADLIKDSNYRSKFSHDGEIAQPGYYSVGLQTPNATAEVTVSGTLSGIHQYTLHGTATNSDAFVLVDVCHTISKNACRNASVSTTVTGGTSVVSGSVLTAGSLTGRSTAGGVWVYFYSIIPNAVSSSLWMNETLLANSVETAATASGSLGAYVKLNTSHIEGAADLVANVRIGISFISVSNAKNNLMAPQATGPSGSFTSFADAKSAAQAKWEGMLGRVTVGTDSNTAAVDVAKFYGGIYRASLAPTTYTEANMQYLGFDFKVHTWDKPGQYHSDMSLWDIHRSQTPLLTLLAPDVSRDVINSLLTMYQEGGHLPRWPLANVYTGCMVASHGIEVVADAVMKGVQGINSTLAFEASYAASNGQDKQDQYTKYGYIPSEVDSHAASSTLAYAFDDWATSQLAGVIGQVTTQQEMLARSKNYRNVWSTEMFFCPKSEAGNITCPKIPEMPYPIEKDYTEGNAWQYLWFVPGDPEGLVALFPSVDAYVSRLNFFFAESLKWPLGTFMPNPYYWAGNEPDLLAAWQFNFAGNDYANYTQYWTRKMLDVKYGTTADGLPGNDDFGTMSAWEVWAYMGLYPLSGSRRFSIGAPAFPSVNVTLPASVVREGLGEGFAAGGADTTVLSIVAHGAGPTAVYVSKATCNGSPLASPFVTWDQLVNDGKGGVLEFWMDDAPHPWPTA